MVHVVASLLSRPIMGKRSVRKSSSKSRLVFISCGAFWASRQSVWFVKTMLSGHKVVEKNRSETGQKGHLFVFLLLSGLSVISHRRYCGPYYRPSSLSKTVISLYKGKEDEEEEKKRNWSSVEGDQNSKDKRAKKKDSHHSFLALLYPEATPMKRGETEKLRADEKHIGNDFRD